MFVYPKDNPFLCGVFSDTYVTSHLCGAAVFVRSARRHPPQHSAVAENKER